MASSSTPNLVPPEDGRKATEIRWLIFALAALVSSINYIHRYSWGVIKPFLLEEGVVNEDNVGWLDGVFNLTYGLGQFPGGFLGDLRGPRLVITVAAVLWSCVAAGPALVGSVWSFVAIRLGLGATQAAAYPCLGKVTHSWFPASVRTGVQGFVSSFAGRAGAALSPLIIATLLMGYCGLTWRQALLATVLPGLVFAAIFWWLFRNSPREHPRVNEAEARLIEEGKPPKPDKPKFRFVWSRANKWNVGMFFSASFCSAFADGLFVYWITTFLKDEKGFGPAEMGIFGSIPLWGGALGGLCGGFLNDLLIRWIGNRKWARRLIASGCKVIAAFLICGSLYFEDGRVIMGVLFFCKFFSDMSQPTWWGTVTDIGGPASGRVFGMVNTFGSLGAFAAGPIMAWVLKMQGFDGLFYFVGGVYLLTALFWLQVDCTRRLVVEED